MTFIRSAFICGAIAGALAAAATAGNAADLGGYHGGSIKDGMPAHMAAARFYGRIDGSYAGYDKPSVDIGGRFDLLDREIDSNWAFGGGVGYYFNKHIRADVTVERRFETDVSGTVPANSLAFGFPQARGKVGLESTVVMVNAYYDFDVRGRFTPYVGAGIGWAHHETSGASVGDPCCVATVAKKSSSDIAAALMAGMVVNLTNRGVPAGSGEGGGDAARNVYLDLGYRFLYLGQADAGPTSLPLTTIPPTTVTASGPSISEIHAHEFRVGLRLDLR